MPIPEFKGWPKIARWSREVIITEKIDGTNASVYVPEDHSEPLIAGSRNRWLLNGDDNYGFAKWVEKEQWSLRLLGPGTHFGEWWGVGIQRNYGLKEKRFSIFNVDAKLLQKPGLPFNAVPVLYRGLITETHSLVIDVMANLSEGGSVAAPGFMKPEGIIIFHTAGRVAFKKTFENDEKGKEQ